MTKYYLSKELDGGARVLMKESESHGIVPMYCHSRSKEMCGNYCAAFTLTPDGAVYCSLTKDGAYFNISGKDVEIKPMPKSKLEVLK
jgi:hypothetical protein